MAGTPRAAKTDQQLSDEYGQLGTGGRVLSNVLDAIGLAANGATGGAGGAIKDAISGDPIGTAAHEARFRLNNSGPLPIGTAADLVGGAAGLVGGTAVAKAAPALIRTALTAAPAVGTRAAALGATAAAPYARTALALAGPTVGVLGGAALLNGSAAPAAGPAVDPNTGRTDGLDLSKLSPVDAALAQGRSARATAQENLGTAISTILGKNPSIADVQGVGQLVPASIKVGQTQKDMIFGNAYAQSKAIADQQVSAIAQDVAAGKTTEEEGRKATQAALLAHFHQTAGLVGFNPERLAIADQLNAGGEVP